MGHGNGRPAWPFLIARGRDAGYQTIVCPAPLLDGDAYGILEREIAPNPHRDEPLVQELRTGDGRIFTAVHVSHVAATQDLPGEADLRDRHGRPLLLIYGFVWERIRVIELSDTDVDTAFRIAVTEYGRFLADEDRFEISVKESFATVSAVEVRHSPTSTAMHVLPGRDGAAAVDAPPARGGITATRLALAVAALAALLLLLLRLVIDGMSAEMIRYADGSANIQVSVPKGWQQDTAEQTWSPVRAGLRGDALARPVLRASSDLAGFGNPEDASSGVFIGITAARSPVPPGLGDHTRVGNGGCTKGAQEEKTVGTIKFVITPWTDCRIGVAKIEEIAAFESGGIHAWIQIKQATGDPDVTEAILSSLQISTP